MVADEVRVHEEVTICRRRNDRRQELDELEDDDALDVGLVTGNERRKVPRRRQIDPTTCERDYTQDEIEFMHALDAYKRASGRMFPTCSEILEVIRGLGYVRVPQAAVAASSEPTTEAAPAAEIAPPVEADVNVLA